MKLDKDTIDKIRDAYVLLDRICDRYPDCDCEDCLLAHPVYAGRPVRGFGGGCVRMILKDIITQAELKHKGDPT